MFNHISFVKWECYCFYNTIISLIQIPFVNSGQIALRFPGQFCTDKYLFQPVVCGYNIEYSFYWEERPHWMR
jgi:hypothetical protein